MTRPQISNNTRADAYRAGINRSIETLLAFFACARRAFRCLLRFAVRHHRFVECLALGALASQLLAGIPFCGGFLAACAMAVAICVGLVTDLLHMLDNAC